MIKDSLIKKFPEWYKDLSPDKHYLVMSNDFDSYFSCRVLKEMFNLEIGGFYEFESGLWLNKEKTEDKQPIYVDLSITKGMTFDNHYTFIDNPLAINPNVDVSIYNRKYNGSTLALICALYDYDINKTNRLTTLLCVDGWYYGYYNENGEYRNINLDWYKTFGMEDKLLPILRANERDYFEKYIQRHNLNSIIRIKNKRLYCNVSIPLPEYEFELALPVHKQKMTKKQLQTIYLENPDSIITSAETFNNCYMVNRKE